MRSGTLVCGGLFRHGGMEILQAMDKPQDPLSTTWHLCWRAAVGREYPDFLHARIRARIIDAHRRKGRVLLSFLILPGEIHTISSVCQDDSASALARSIGPLIARWVRATSATHSHVFAGAYQAQQLDATTALRKAVCLLALRPVTVGVCQSPSHCDKGVIRVALGLSAPEGFDARPLLQLFGPSVPEARAELRAWLSQRPSAAELSQWELSMGFLMSKGLSIENRETARPARSIAAAALLAAASEPSVDSALRLLDTWVRAKLGIQGVSSLRSATGQPGAHARAVVAELAVRNKLCSADAVARHFGRARSTLCEQMAAVRKSAMHSRLIVTPAHRVIAEVRLLQDSCRSGERAESRHAADTAPRAGA
jgi:hypothetical protein